MYADILQAVDNEYNDWSKFSGKRISMCLANCPNNMDFMTSVSYQILVVLIRITSFESDASWKINSVNSTKELETNDNFIAERSWHYIRINSNEKESGIGIWVLGTWSHLVGKELPAECANKKGLSCDRIPCDKIISAMIKSYFADLLWNE